MTDDRDDFWTGDRKSALAWAARCVEALDGVESAAGFLGLADRPLDGWLSRFLFGRRIPKE